MLTPTILIAHHDETTRDNLKKILANKFPLVVVENPEDALLILNSKTRVALLFLDAVCTDDQETLLGNIREVQPELTIIILANETNETNALEAVRLGANGYIFTPVKIEELLTIVEQSMAKIKD